MVFPLTRFCANQYDLGSMTLLEKGGGDSQIIVGVVYMEGREWDRVLYTGIRGGIEI